MIHHMGYGAGSGSGDPAGWAVNVTPGSLDALYVENCGFYLNNTNASPPTIYDYGTTAIQSYYGARTVFRYNFLWMVQTDQHGTAGSVGARWWELYGNTNYTVSNGAQDKYYGIRGGSGVIFNNWKIGFPNGGNGGISLYEEDNGYPALYQIGRGKDQVLDPAYVWNNQNSPSDANGLKITGGGSANVQLNRDFFLTTKPSYTPATFPHPSTPGVVDTTAPLFSSATINAAGTAITIVYNEACKFGAGGNAGFTLGMSGGAVTASYNTGAGSSVHVYTLSRTVNNGETGTIAYSQPINGVEDMAGNDIATYSGQTVVNNSTQGDGVAPTLTSRIVWTNGNTIHLFFSEPVAVGPGGNGGWTCSLSGGAATLTYQSGSGTAELVYLVNRAATAGYVDYRETGTISYVQPGNGIQDSPFGNDLANLGPVALANNSLANTIDILPPDRQIDWEASGVPGGIPTFSTIFATVTSAPYNADNTGAIDSSVPIQTAINAAAAAGGNQIVLIPAGTYTWSNRVDIPSNVELKGAGASSVKVNTYALWHAIQIGSFPSAPVDTAVVGSLTNGQTTVKVFNVTTPSLVVGDLIVVDQINDGAIVTNSPVDAVLGTTPQPSRDSNTRNLAQITRVTGVSGTNLTVSPAICWPFTNTLSPEVWELTQGITRTTNCGVRGFTLDRKYPTTTTDGYDLIKCVGAAAFWITEMRLTNSIWWDIELDRCFQASIYKNDLRDPAFRTPGAGYGIVPFNVSGWHRIENNLFTRHRHSLPVILTIGNVIAYNLSVNSDQGDGWLAGDLFPHGAHTAFNLFEGNCAVRSFNDWTHGSGSHNTYFRNFFMGVSDFSSANSGRRFSDSDIHNTRNSYVGNIMGTNNAYAGAYTSFETGNTRVSSGIYIWSYGFLSDGDGIYDSDEPRLTLFRHGNYDDYNDTLSWDPLFINQSLPASLYLDSKPQWFGGLTFPPYNPAQGGSATIIMIPAGYRYVLGVDPPANNNPFALSKPGRGGKGK